MNSRSQVLSLCTALAFVLAGCGGTENDTQQSQNTEPSAESQLSTTHQEGKQAQEP